MSGGQRVQGAGVIGALKDFKRVRYTSGAITLNNSSGHANVQTATDLVLMAGAGDILEVGIDALLSGTGPETYFTVSVIVGGSVVKNLATGTATEYFIPGWTAPGSVGAPVAGAYIGAPLEAGDIVDGTVTLRLRYQTATAVNRSLFASTTDGLVFWAKNLGQVNVGSVLAPIFTPREIILSRVAALTVPNISETNIPWDTEVSDPSGAFAVPITAIVLPAGWGGIWTLLVRGAFAGGGVGTGRAFHQFLDGAFNNRAAIGSGEDATYASLAGVRYPDGQSLTVSVFHTAGASRTWTGRLEMHRIGD